ncbi:hypothetical protein AAVH_29728 [Aphelenchoides avenae]|nr:hypothetical protein AAVH_29728 [Aphelenchus avenae]
MQPSAVFGILILLPAVAHRHDFVSVVARLQKIHDIPTLFEEIEREGERALITVAINPAVYVFSAEIESYLEGHKKFALGFGRYAQDAVYLAKLYLSRDELQPDTRNELTADVEEFEKWLASMSQRGIITYEADEEAPIYVGPGVDPSTEDLRKMLRLIHHESTEVPEDPIVGGELRLHMVSFARGLAILGFFPTDPE